MDMPSPNRSAVLPWLAAATAMLVTLLAHGVTYGALMAIQTSDNDGTVDRASTALMTLADSWVLGGGLAFLIAQWHGERCAQLAFRQRAKVLVIYGSLLLVLRGVQIALMTALMWLPSESAMFSVVIHNRAVLNVAIGIAACWLAWVLATHWRRADVQPATAQADARLRTAGLAGWLLVAALLVASWVLEDYQFLPLSADAVTWICVRAAMLVFGALAMGGAWIGLPKPLAAVHSGRLLMVSFLATACSLALLSFIGLLAIAAIAAPYYTIGPALIVLVLGLPLVGVPGFFFIATRVGYRRLSRA